MTATWHRLDVPAHSTTEVIPVGSNPWSAWRGERRTLTPPRPGSAAPQAKRLAVGLLVVADVAVAFVDAARNWGSLAAAMALAVAAWKIWRS